MHAIQPSLPSLNAMCSTNEQRGSRVHDFPYKPSKSKRRANAVTETKLAPYRTFASKSPPTNDSPVFNL